MKQLLVWILALSLISAQGCATLASDEATVGCQVADVATTAIALSMPGLIEANPIMAGIIGAVGIPGLLAIKLLFAWWLISNNDVDQDTKAVVNTATCGVAVHNLLL